jgi:CheY-like chemotaxis protein
MNERGPILVTEDDDDTRDLLAMALRADGYDVVTAPDGQAALDALSAGIHPALMLVDVMMPRMDGETFLTNVRSRPELAGIPAILLSGNASSWQGTGARLASACIAKPVELDDLLEAVRRTLGS